MIPNALRAIFALILVCPLYCAAGAEIVIIPSGSLQIPGHWFKAQAGVGPRPAVIDLSGCEGALDAQGELGSYLRRDASYFNAEGMHLLVPDSFAARGQKSICETPNRERSLNEEHRRADVFAAIRWLSQQPGVDAKRIVVMGRSHGAQTVLSVLDRTDAFVAGQALQPRAAIALYPGCEAYGQKWVYEITAPLLMMVGDLDNLTPARECVNLAQKLRRSQKDAVIEFTVFPGSYHAFDSAGPVRRTGAGNVRGGSAMAGGNPQAREKAHELAFEFLSRQLETPLRLTHAQRFKTHHFEVPAPSGFAAADDANAVPLSEQGRARYQYFLTLPVPKAFAITERGGWHFDSGQPDAMESVLDRCEKAKTLCWLYAVDDSVVWQADAGTRFKKGLLRVRRHQ